MASSFIKRLRKFAAAGIISVVAVNSASAGLFCDWCVESVRPYTSPACKPNWGYHQAKWTRFPAIQAGFNTGDYCPTCEAGNVVEQQSWDGVSGANVPAGEIVIPGQPMTMDPNAAYTSGAPVGNGGAAMAAPGFSPYTIPPMNMAPMNAPATQATPGNPVPANGFVPNATGVAPLTPMPAPQNSVAPIPQSEQSLPTPAPMPMPAATPDSRSTSYQQRPIDAQHAGFYAQGQAGVPGQVMRRPFRPMLINGQLGNNARMAAPPAYQPPYTGQPANTFSQQPQTTQGMIRGIGFGQQVPPTNTNVPTAPNAVAPAPEKKSWLTMPRFRMSWK